ncbi:hypothetical protein ACJBRL_10340 [Streptococcus suis]
MTVRNVRPINGYFILYNHEGKEYVIRVIALENDTVTDMDEDNYRNDIIVKENY